MNDISYILVGIVSRVVYPLREFMDIVSPHRDPDERQSPDDEVIDTKIGQLTTAHILGAEL